MLSAWQSSNCDMKYGNLKKSTYVSKRYVFNIYFLCQQKLRFIVSYETYASPRLLNLSFTIYDYSWDNIDAEMTTAVYMCTRNHVYAKCSIKSRVVV